MTDNPSATSSRMPHFNITTRGAAVDSLKGNPQFRDRQVAEILSNLQVSPKDWAAPLNPFESSLVLTGILAGAHSLKTPVMVTMDREFWLTLKESELSAKNGSHAKEVFCPDPQAATMVYHPTPQEASV
ncbi:hypothetical protein ACJU26_08285 [Acidithiobacillus sp. M4-SHS-6]|uniref:hypothetical protein n=1 Tax=Acidithiobacillus sp. M4-SHS-6 TaxID=3383024 RepID=UPI0039BE8816